MTYFTTGAQLQAALNALPNTKTGNFVAFDSFFYGQQYMADYQGTLSPIEHFVQIGAARGYKPNATFDPTYYKTAFADLKNTDFNAADLLYHYMQYGLDEGRIPSEALATFDGTAYLAANPDVAAKVNANLAQFGGSVTNGALAHYVKFGAAEGRTAPGTSVSNGQTFTLTAGVDNIVGTSGNDTIIGGAGSAGGTSTLGAADVINGGAGTDTLQVSIEGTAATVSPNLTSVEIIKAQALGTGGATVNMVNATGATALMNNNSTDALSFTNVQALAAVHLVKGDATKNTTVSFIDSLVAGTSDAVSVVLDDAKAATLSVAGTSAGGFETVNVTALAGKSAVGTLESNFAANSGTKTINIDGAGSVKLSNIAATVTTINASANTGGADVHIDSGTALDVTFTGGSGDDQLRMENTLTTLDKLDGGAGRDTIHVTNGAALVDGLQVTNFELLDVAAATGGTYNMSKLAGIDTLVVSNSTAGAVTVNNLAKGAKVVLGGENTAANLIDAGGLAINVKDSGAGSANDVIDVAINSKVGVTTGGDVTIANIETVNFTASSANAGVTHNLSGQTVLAHALTINANADTANLTIADLGALALVSFDASASVKNVSVTTGADTFTATGGTAFKFGAGNDTLNLTGAVGGSTGVDFVINGGKGGDNITLAAAGQVEVLVYAAGDSQAGVVAGVNQFDSVTNFTTTEDKINLASLGFSGSAVATIKVGAAVDISTTTGAVNANKMANFFGAGGDMRAVVTVDDGTNTWVYVDANKDGSFQGDSDLVIALMGVNGGTAPVAGDFVFAA